MNSDKFVYDKGDLSLLIPACKSCSNYIPTKNGVSAKCKVFGEIPLEIKRADTLECSKYLYDKNSKFAEVK